MVCPLSRVYVVGTSRGDLVLLRRRQHYCLSADVSNPSFPRLPIPAMVCLCRPTRVRAFVICPGAQARTRSSVNSCGCDVRHILMITPHRSPPRCSSLHLDRRTEERRVGNEGGSTSRSRGSPYH